MISFQEYLAQKNIAEDRFRAGEPELFREWELLFLEIHPDSFTAQKKFLINDIRRRFILDNHKKLAANKPVKS